MFNKREYDKNFDKKHYWHMNLTLPKEYKESVSLMARQKGISKNALVKKALDEFMKG